MDIKVLHLAQEKTLICICRGSFSCAARDRLQPMWVGIVCVDS